MNIYRLSAFGRYFDTAGKKRSGMLETLLCKIITDNEVSQCIDRFFECIRDESKIDITRMEKACAHFYVATKAQPHVSVGVAALKGDWNLNTCNLRMCATF